MRARCVVLTSAALLLILAATSWWWDLGGPVPVAQPAYPLVPLLALVGLLCAVATRNWWPAAFMAVAVTVAAVAIVPTLRPAQAGLAGAAGAGPTVRIMAVNTYFGQADLVALQREVEDRRVDLLVLTEAGPQFTPHVLAGGVARLLPHNSGGTLGGASGTLILSRYPMRVLDRDDVVVDSHQEPTVEITVEGRPVLVRGVHPRSPTSAEKLVAWREDLTALTRWRDELAGPVIMAGDFNSAWPHPGFRELAEGMTDALQATGQAWTPTWPSQGTTPLFTQIDHVLVRGAEVLEAGTVPVPGSDHLGVHATVRLP